MGGGGCLLSQQPFHKMDPSPLGKYKKRNRIMHVLLKFAFMITLNFVYYLCIIEIECTLFFTKAPVFIVIYILSCKIVPSALPHYENKWLEMKVFFSLKNDKRKKK